MVPTVMDAEAEEGEAGSGVVLRRVGAGLLAASAAVRAVGAWTVGPCVDALSVWGLRGTVGLAVAWPGVCPGRPCESKGPLTLARAAAAVGAPVAGVGVVCVAGPDSVPLPGTRVWGEDGVRRSDAGTGGVGTPEVAPSGVPSAVADAPASVLCIVPAVTAGEVGSPPQVPLVNVMGEGVTEVILADISFKTLVMVSMDEFCSEFSSVLLRTEYRGCGAVRWLSDKDQEETQMSTRAVHILQVSWQQGWAVPEAPSLPFLRLLTVPCCLAEEREAAARGVCPGWAIFLGGLRA